jgi:hypothetical protein
MSTTNSLTRIEQLVIRISERISFATTLGLVNKNHSLDAIRHSHSSMVTGSTLAVDEIRNWHSKGIDNIATKNGMPLL